MHAFRIGANSSEIEIMILVRTGDEKLWKEKIGRTNEGNRAQNKIELTKSKKKRSKRQNVKI